jgi:hypothetical protein
VYSAQEHNQTPDGKTVSREEKCKGEVQTCAMTEIRAVRTCVKQAAKNVDCRVSEFDGIPSGGKDN